MQQIPSVEPGTLTSRRMLPRSTLHGCSADDLKAWLALRTHLGGANASQVLRHHRKVIGQYEDARMQNYVHLRLCCTIDPDRRCLSSLGKKN